MLRKPRGPLNIRKVVGRSFRNQADFDELSELQSKRDVFDSVIPLGIDPAGIVATGCQRVENLWSFIIRVHQRNGGSGAERWSRDDFGNGDSSADSFSG